MSLEGKTVLITGSSRGIGAAIATRFAQQRARIVIHGRDDSALRKVKDELTWAGSQVIYATADLTRFEEIEAMRHQIESEYGVVDVLVTNAGGSYTSPGPFEQISEQGWHASVEGNLTTTFLTIKSFLPSMKGHGSGNIITISSAAGRRANPHSPIPYAVAKAGIQILTQDLAAELGSSGIRVNCIAPETILTERNLERIPKSQQESIAQMHPIQRLGAPEDIAEAALFLATEASSWITGVILDVAGGAVMV